MEGRIILINLHNLKTKYPDHVLAALDYFIHGRTGSRNFKFQVLKIYTRTARIRCVDGSVYNYDTVTWDKSSWEYVIDLWKLHGKPDYSHQIIS